MSILLTGATGFLGGSVLDLLLARGATVHAFGRRAPHARTGVHFVPGDLATGAGLADVPWGEIQQVLHLAAAGVKAARRDWPDAVFTNVVGTQRLLAAIDRHGAQSTVLHVRTFYEDAIERHPALKENPYIATKAAASALFRIWAERYRGRTAMARLFQVFGPGDDAGSVLSYAARSLRAGTPCVFGSGRGERDWIYVDDAAEALVHGLEQASTGGIEFDVGTGVLTSIRTTVEKLAEQMGRSPSLLTFDATRDRPDGDLGLQAERLPAGWRPRYSLSDGLARLAALP